MILGTKNLITYLHAEPFVALRSRYVLHYIFSVFYTVSQKTGPLLPFAITPTVLVQ